MAEPVEFSGAQWCERFPTSTFLGDLAEPFRTSAGNFIAALRDAGAAVAINATWRPAERAYLMHWCCMIGAGGQLPDAVDGMPGVSIDWSCGGNIEAALEAARAMMKGYEIAFPAALVSRHTQRLAVDMTIAWKGAIAVKSARGITYEVTRQDQLWIIGATYGVHKLPSDPPHWSIDGH